MEPIFLLVIIKIFQKPLSAVGKTRRCRHSGARSDNDSICLLKHSADFLHLSRVTWDGSLISKYSPSVSYRQNTSSVLQVPVRANRGNGGGVDILHQPF